MPHFEEILRFVFGVAADYPKAASALGGSGVTLLALAAWWFL